MAKIKKIFATISLENISGPDAVLIYRGLEKYNDNQVDITWYQNAGKVWIKVYDLKALQAVSILLPLVSGKNKE